jgi:hypothetical protein
MLKRSFIANETNKEYSFSKQLENRKHSAQGKHKEHCLQVVFLSFCFIFFNNFIGSFIAIKPRTLNYEIHWRWQLSLISPRDDANTASHLYAAKNINTKLTFTIPSSRRVASKPIEKNKRTITANRNVRTPEGRGKTTISAKEMNTAIQSNNESQ